MLKNDLLSSLLKIEQELSVLRQVVGADTSWLVPDHIAEWISQEIEPRSHNWMLRSDLMATYDLWAHTNGRRSYPSTREFMAKFRLYAPPFTEGQRHDGERVIRGLGYKWEPKSPHVGL